LPRRRAIWPGCRKRDLRAIALVIVFADAVNSTYGIYTLRVFAQEFAPEVVKATLGKGRCTYRPEEQKGQAEHIVLP